MTALDELRELYAGLPTLQCRGMCANSCGPIDMSDVERDRLQELGVQIPVFTRADAKAWARGERLDCPALSPLRTCKVYTDRPLICRLWGMAESMPCEWGCRPTRMLSDREAYDLIFRAMEIGGSRNLGEARKLRAKYEELQADPELGDLFARFIRGETQVEPEILAILEQRHG